VVLGRDASALGSPDWPGLSKRLRPDIRVATRAHANQIGVRDHPRIRSELPSSRASPRACVAGMAGEPWPALINTYAGVAESERDGSTPDQLAKSMLDGRRVCGHGRSPVNAWPLLRVICGHELSRRRPVAYGPMPPWVGSCATRDSSATAPTKDRSSPGTAGRRSWIAPRWRAAGAAPGVVARAMYVEHAAHRSHEVE
jgi:hypothetical protein